MSTFTLTIRLGNDAMQTSADVAGAINAAVYDLQGEQGGYEPLTPGNGPIYDVNGNRVGKWEVN